MSHEGLQLNYEEALTRPVPIPTVAGTCPSKSIGVNSCHTRL